MARQRIRLPNSSGSEEFYDIVDFNIGKTVELHGRLFKMTNCDQFTRVFLNRLGIAVPDPIAMPADPYTLKRDQVNSFLLFLHLQWDHTNSNLNISNSLIT